MRALTIQGSYVGTVAELREVVALAQAPASSRIDGAFGKKLGEMSEGKLLMECLPAGAIVATSQAATSTGWRDGLGMK